LDLHARQVTECRQVDGSTPKAPQQWQPKELLAQVEAWVKGIRLTNHRVDAPSDGAEGSIP
jgi:hypothetical protein